MPPKFSGMAAIFSGTDTDTEASTTKASVKPRNKKESLIAQFGPGRRISETHHAMKPKPPPSPSSNRRSTRSTSKARTSAPATASEPPPVPTVNTSPNKSPGKRGRAPAPPQPTTRRVTRSQSPVKPRIIADSPPPEDRMNPFPPKRAPMTVSDKPAVYNRYGEKVVAPVDIAQKLRQAVNFLSDEGPENCADFEDKLRRLDIWLDKHHPLGDGVNPEGEQETENLYRKVKYMIWVHRNRLEEGAEQWFTRNQLPDSKSMIKPIKPGERDQWRVTQDGVALSVPQHPKLQVMLAQDRERIPKERAERAKVVAAAKEATTARTTQAPAAKASIAATEAEDEAESEDEKLPSLPYPEVWHRKEARRFPYGETPHMEQVMSRQISADLARGREAKEAMQGGMLRPLWKAIDNIWPFAPQEDTRAPYDPWALPEMTIDEVYDADKIFNYLGTQVKTVPASPGTKRKAEAALDKSPPKRYRPGI